ncbi:MAG: galactose-1-epimerase, partial [Bacteroidales bacterium]|nr:galactose-1-epimerase [Bacteroidales bacterium]
MKRTALSLVITLLLITTCGGAADRTNSIIEETWGETGGKTVKLFTLTNKAGMVIKVSTFGATLTYVSAPDLNGNFDPVVLGFDSLSMYLA